MVVDKLFVATKALIVHEGKVLLLQESTAYADGTNAGKWDLPGGRLHPDESFRDALLREVKEETGLDVTVGGCVYVDEWWPQVRGEQWHVVGMFFVCKSQSVADVVLSTDHAAFEWVPLAESERFQLTKGTQGALEALSTFLHEDKR
ncbi:MAG: NUDIX domain-containing protein [Candidatus Doudnabacteria bacterium]|nr:NUDIX domain-containing protein [Candidatus Doudnabacteria bacterium]